jgi:hypothetical protein
MNKTRTLKSYEDWKHCITVLCGIPLTTPYIEQRLIALRDPSDYTTRKFVATWGEQHRLRVIGWFEQAHQEMGGSNIGASATPSGRAT